MTKEKKITPFSCGADFHDWHYNNCSDCKKCCEDVDKTCILEKRLSFACIFEGEIKISTLKKINKNAVDSLENFNCEKKEVEYEHKHN